VKFRWVLPSPQEYRPTFTSPSTLLYIWFKYLTSIPETATITLRGNGLLLPRSIWKRDTPAWRLSIEDPFERVDSIDPHDLGKVLSVGGMAKLRIALRETVNTFESMDLSRVEALFQVRKYRPPTLPVSDRAVLMNADDGDSTGAPAEQCSQQSEAMPVSTPNADKETNEKRTCIRQY
jgi:hypothetical protein